jgi:hypothetical protein
MAHLVQMDPVGRDAPAYRQAGDHTFRWCVRGTHLTFFERKEV